MVALRWFLVLAFSVVADLANPALPGALELFAEAEEVVHLRGHQRVARQPAAPGRFAIHRERTATAARAATVRQTRSRRASHGEARKAPPPALADAPSAPEDH